MSYRVPACKPLLSGVDEMVTEEVRDQYAITLESGDTTYDVSGFIGFDVSMAATQVDGAMVPAALFLFLTEGPAYGEKIMTTVLCPDLPMDEDIIKRVVAEFLEKSLETYSKQLVERVKSLSQSEAAVTGRIGPES